MEPKISVVIPVGPKPSHKQWLKECIDSATNQTEKPNEIFIIDDMAHIHLDDLLDTTYLSNYDEFTTSGGCSYNGVHINKFDMPWLAGVVTSFNFGIALASNEWILQLGSDDELHPSAIEYAKETINQIGDPYGLYNFSCQMMDTGEIVSWFNHANVVSRSLWKKTGGLHPMTITGGMDAALISVMMIHMPQHLHKIKEGVGLYQVRQHENQYTKESAWKYGDFMVQLRNDLTRDWEPPTWTK